MDAARSQRRAAEDAAAHVRRLVEADDVEALRTCLPAISYLPQWTWGWRDRTTWETPLHLAVRLNRVECARELARAVPDAALFSDCNQCRTALHLAAAEGRAECVEAILQHVPHAAYAKELYSRTALHVAAQNGHERCVDHLLAAAPDAACLQTNRGTPLHLAAQYGYTGIVAKLLQAAPNQATVQRLDDGYTPLHCAVRQRHVGAAELLLRSSPGAATMADPMGRLPLHTAASKGPLPLLRMLLHAAPQAATAADHSGGLPLHNAAVAGRPTYVRLLLSVAPETKVQLTVHGSSPLYLAAMGGNASCVRLLATPDLAMLPNEAQWTPLHEASAGLRLDCVRYLVDLAPQAAMVKNQWGCTPLMWAATRQFKPERRVECVRMLAAAVPAAVEIGCDDTGETPLHVMARDDLAEGARHLLAVAPSAARAVDKRGMTPLHYATMVESQECVRVLACAAPDTADVEDEEGVAPLDFADGETAGTLLLALLRSTRRPLDEYEWDAVDAEHPDLLASLPAALECGDKQAGWLVQRLPQTDRMRLRATACALSLGGRTRPALPPELVRSIVALL